MYCVGISHPSIYSTEFGSWRDHDRNMLAGGDVLHRNGLFFILVLGLGCLRLSRSHVGLTVFVYTVFLFHFHLVPL